MSTCLALRARLVPFVCVLACLFAGGACGESTKPRGTAPADGGVAEVDAEDGAAPDGAAAASGIPGLSLMRRLAGLWSGPVTSTVLGDFPLVNMDMRAATPRILFGRVDMDADNSLRFAVFVGTFGGKDVLTFRNGGLFKGLPRDSWTVLVDVDEAAARYHFCSSDRGCGYIDATFTFSSSDSLVFDVKVKGAPHEHWTPRRTEPRAPSDPFPADMASQGNGTEPFPDLPSLNVVVPFGKTLAADADVWLMLSKDACSAGDCLSRWFTSHVKAGASSVSFVVDQLHAGTYRATAVLDADRNLGSTFAPGSGDGVSLPNQTLTVADKGATAATYAIVYTLP